MYANPPINALGATLPATMLRRVRAALPHLLPWPKKIRRRAGDFRPAACREVRCEKNIPPAMVERLRAVLHGGVSESGTVVRFAPYDPARLAADAFHVAVRPLSSPEHYELTLGPAGAALVGGSERGLFYGTQTLAQILRQARAGRVPALRISDGPDFPVRGFYHDVSRGKVPTLATLCGLVEKLAHYKINQLQLYVEHTFAFRNHPDIWAGSDPLTADDIRALDEHAARHHVELVPSLSTFGHFYTALVSPRKHHLNELPIDASQLPFSIWDRMGHYTLDCRNPAALALVREMILELRPLFRSRLFNLCCDETFDLGQGRNAPEAQRIGRGRLYLDFLQQLIAVVRDAGATPMFWGDIIGHHPELVRELPRDVIALDWDYSADLKDTKSRRFQQAGVPYYVCPGVAGWDRWLNDLDLATVNILALARRGRRDDAIGLLTTDWGDRGHINALGHSFHGLILGAAAGWNTRAAAADPAAFDAAFASLEFGDESGRTVARWREAARLNVVSWRWLTLWLDPTPHRPATWWDERTGVPVELLAIDPRRAFAAHRRLERIRATLVKVKWSSAADEIVRRELLAGCRGSALMNALGGWIVCLAAGRQPPRGAPAALDLANDIRRFEAEFSAVWHARNRPAEYWRVRTTLLELARRLEQAALRGVWLRTPRPSPPPAAS